MAAKRYTVESIWADSFGNFYARVKDSRWWEFEGKRFSDAEWAGLRSAARRAIVRELQDDPHFDPRSIRMEYVPGLGRVEGQAAYVGRPESIVFREVPA